MNKFKIYLLVMVIIGGMFVFILHHYYQYQQLSFVNKQIDKFEDNLKYFNHSDKGFIYLAGYNSEKIKVHVYHLSKIIKDKKLGISYLEVSLDRIDEVKSKYRIKDLPALIYVSESGVEVYEANILDTAHLEAWINKHQSN